ncbi:MAG TPA: ABC transporter ATP-binding protein [Spirochaetia bacterium]|nr:ABC transporter ATP-binding protein [Spirochaetia bacterium]
MAAVKNGITLQALCKEYRLGTTTVAALCNVDLEIRSGSFVCVAGPSGSGKTTLLNLIGLIDTPTSGTVHVAGEDIQGLPEKLRTRYRSRTLGFIFQSFNLLPVLDVFENVHLPLILHRELSAEEKKGRVMEMIEAVGLADHVRHKPFELSGGQRQRVAIARALVTHPHIVLADEPTANLDSRTGAEVLDLMVRINAERGTTFIFSSHDPKVMERAARVVRLHDGQVEAA